MGSLARWENNFLNYTLKNAVAYFSAGVAAVNSKVVGVAPGAKRDVRNEPMASGFNLTSANQRTYNMPDRCESPKSNW
jgi:hypothetical protein